MSGSYMMPIFGRNCFLDTGIRGQRDPGKDAIFLPPNGCHFFYQCGGGGHFTPPANLPHSPLYYRTLVILDAEADSPVT